MLTMTSASPSTRPRGVPFRLVPLHAEGLERKLTLAFGFMSFIPILIVVWAMVYDVDLGIAIYPIVTSAFVGYFVVARRMVKSVLLVAERAREIADGQVSGRIEVAESNEIGELARSFNRITQELEKKVEQLESSRQLVKRLLSRIGTAIISYEGIDYVLTLTVENTVAALEAQMGSLLLLDGEKQELYVKTMWSPNGHPPGADQRIRLGDGIAGWVAKEGRPLRSTGTPAALGLASGRGREGVVLCVPLKLRNQAIGVMAVLREDVARPFTEDDESLMASIGSQMAVAIENYRLNLDVEQTYLETIVALALAVEAKDPYSAGHSKRVGYYASRVGELLGLDKEMLRVLNDAGTLHDIGKIGIKDEILLKQAPLSADEARIMQQHSAIGEAIVKPVRSLQKVVSLVRHHHERFDGSGYPDGLKGAAIPLGARILSVVDTYDAMVTDRPYRKRRSVEEAKAELQRQAGVQHDPVVVEAFLRFIDEKQERLAAALARHQS
jgi:HD-GYP domain-containing protein (c-di-GMP phosphodiesterase class II)/HAMP domain-containing protein